MDIDTKLQNSRHSECNSENDQNKSTDKICIQQCGRLRLHEAQSRRRHELMNWQMNHNHQNKSKNSFITIHVTRGDYFYKIKDSHRIEFNEPNLLKKNIALFSLDEDWHKIISLTEDIKDIHRYVKLIKDPFFGISISAIPATVQTDCPTCTQAIIDNFPQRQKSDSVYQQFEIDLVPGISILQNLLNAPPIIVIM